MNVTLPSALETFVRRQVESGAFENESELVSESLRQMQEREDAWRSEAASKIEAGLKQAEAGMLLSGPGVEARLNEAKAQWRARRNAT